MMKHTATRVSLACAMLALVTCFNCSWSQSEDYAAKASIIDGIRAFEAGEDLADSLFVLGERHSDPISPGSRPTTLGARRLKNPKLDKKPGRPSNGPSNQHPISN